MNEYDLTVLDLLESTTKRAPSSTAIVVRDGVITYADLSARCKRMAASITALQWHD